MPAVNQTANHILLTSIGVYKRNVDIGEGL